jgi:hypothetical protein
VSRGKEHRGGGPTDLKRIAVLQIMVGLGSVSILLRGETEILRLSFNRASQLRVTPVRVEGGSARELTEKLCNATAVIDVGMGEKHRLYRNLALSDEPQEEFDLTAGINNCGTT